MTDHPAPSTYLKPADEGDLFHPSMLDEIANAIRGRAVQDVIDKRIEQLVRYGHSAEHDAMLPIGELPAMARKEIGIAIERITGSEEKQELPAARKSMVRALAIGLAAIDRLDAAIAAQTKQRGLL